MKFRPWGWKVVAVAGVGSLASYLASSVPVLSEEKKCPETDAGLRLPNGFCATIFADKVGHARQLVVAPNDTVYVNTWSGVYYGNDTPPTGGFLVALKDTKGTGHADVNVGSVRRQPRAGTAARVSRSTRIGFMPKSTIASCATS